MALDTLDPNRPLDGDALNLGDDAIRETRQAMINSFKVEHALNGTHKIPIGTTTQRPAAGTAGRLYLNTDSGLIEVDNGTMWIANRASIPMTPLRRIGQVAPNTWFNVYNTTFTAPVSIMLMGNVTLTRGGLTSSDETYQALLQTSPPAWVPPAKGTQPQFQAKGGFSFPLAWSATGVTGVTIDVIAKTASSGNFDVVMDGGLVVI